MMLFDRLHSETKAVLTRTYKVAHQHGRSDVNPEHLLLALLDAEIVAKALQLLAVDVEALRAGLEAMLTTNAAESTRTRRAGVGQVFIVPRVKQILDQAFVETDQPDAAVSPEHLFLALLREQDTPLAGVLAAYGVTYDKAQPVIESLRGTPSNH